MVARQKRPDVQAMKVGNPPSTSSPRPSLEDLHEVLERDVDAGQDEFTDVIAAWRQPVSVLLK
jgi:hypothetical protein